MIELISAAKVGKKNRNRCITAGKSCIKSGKNNWKPCNYHIFFLSLPSKLKKSTILGKVATYSVIVVPNAVSQCHSFIRKIEIIRREGVKILIIVFLYYILYYNIIYNINLKRTYKLAKT